MLTGGVQSGSLPVRVPVASVLVMMLLLPAIAGAESEKRIALDVRARIVSACAISEGGAHGMSFGSHAGLANRISSVSSSLHLRCVPGVAYKIALGPGQNSLQGRRRLKAQNDDWVVYELYQDAALSTAWNETDVYSSIADGSVQSIPVHGLIGAQATPAAGVYRDVVQVIVQW